MRNRLVVVVGVGIFTIVGLAGAADYPIPVKVELFKFAGSPAVGRAYKIVSKAPRGGPLFTLPASSPTLTEGSLTVSVGAGVLTCDLAAGTWDGQRGWRELGKPAGSKGYKYVNKGAPDNDLCKTVILKEKVIKLIALGTGTVPVPVDYPPGNPDISTVLTFGGDEYCAYAAQPHSREIADRLIKARDQDAPGACVSPTTTTSTSTTTTSTTTTTLDACALTCCDKEYLSFETSVASGTCGEQRRFNCSNDGNSACVEDDDCDFGFCYVTPPICSEDFSVSCTENSDCTGTCGEVFDYGLPRDIDCGRVEFGGGVNSRLLRIVPDRAKPVVKVTSCNSVTGQLTLGPTTPGEVGQRNCTQGRTCDTPPYDQCMRDADCAGSCLDNCLFGPPLPFPDPENISTSVCLVNVVAEDASGTAQCDGGAIDVDIPPVSLMYLTGDLLKPSTPPDVPGIQPCPLCDTLCQGGSKAEFPCDDDSDCPGSTCGTKTQCLGGIDDGDPCVQETSDETVLGQGYPTSHDCRPHPADEITHLSGGLRILTLSLTSGMVEQRAVDLANADRVFCGFCRDVTFTGSYCFEGNTDPGCPAAIPPADGTPVPCTSDADCDDGDEYESCGQFNPGGLGYYTATRIALSGSTGPGCLGDGQSHPTQLAAFFCVPPSFDPTIDAYADLPGPGTVTLQGAAQLH